MMKLEIVKTRISAFRMMRTGKAKSVRKIQKSLLVKSRLRRLKKQWTVEPVQEIQYEFGIDLIAELEAALTAEIENKS